MQLLPGGADVSIWQQWGLPGVLLGLTLGALGWIVRWSVGQNKAREDAQQRSIDVLQGELKDQHAKILAAVEDHNAKTMELLDAQRREFDGRYQALLERMQVQQDTSNVKIHDLATVATRALAEVAAKLPPPVKGPRT